jgi:hypothetical protein
LGYEVDFHARYPDGREELIQVCAETGSGETPDREWRALHDAKGDFPRARLRLVTLTFDQLPAMSTKEIACESAYDWLLEN